MENVHLCTRFKELINTIPLLIALAHSFKLKYLDLNQIIHTAVPVYVDFIEKSSMMLQCNIVNVREIYLMVLQHQKYDPHTHILYAKFDSLVLNNYTYHSNAE